MLIRRESKMIRDLLPVVMVLFASWARLPAAELVGVTVTPHTVAESMRYRRPRDPDLAARVQMFVTGPARPTTFAGQTPAELLQEGAWAWHDLATEVKVPEGALTVWTFNGKSSRWGVGQEFELQAEGLQTRTVPIRAPLRWISAVTFLAPVDQIDPDTIVLHIANDGDQPLAVSSLRLWLPRERAAWHTLWPQEPLAARTVIPARDRGFVKLRAGSALPLTYAALELSTDAGPIWTHLRIKREVFDISGGWVNESLTEEAYLCLLTHLHVNTGQFQTVPGYTDNPALYQRYPLKLFSRLWPLDQWDTDDRLPKIHAVEFLGEPQYGGGRPVPPQAVFDQLLPYRAGRLATSVTHSEERVWRYYAGLSDFPHYDAYRVVAPAADSWRDYDRWGGQRISWGAPLETIGDMCRSLRELNRPLPCAYWSQGPHSGWGGGLFGGGRAPLAHSGRIAVPGGARPVHAYHVALLVQSQPPVAAEVPGYVGADHTHRTRNPDARAVLPRWRCLPFRTPHTDRRFSRLGPGVDRGTGRGRAVRPRHGLCSRPAGARFSVRRAARGVVLVRLAAVVATAQGPVPSGCRRFARGPVAHRGPGSYDRRQVLPRRDLRSDHVAASARRNRRTQKGRASAGGGVPREPEAARRTREVTFSRKVTRR